MNKVGKFMGANCNFFTIKTTNNKPTVSPLGWWFPIPAVSSFVNFGPKSIENSLCDFNSVYSHTTPYVDNTYLRQDTNGN